jgi:hypothetical protein
MQDYPIAHIKAAWPFRKGKETMFQKKIRLYSLKRLLRLRIRFLSYGGGHENFYKLMAESRYNAQHGFCFVFCIRLTR